MTKGIVSIGIFIFCCIAPALSQSADRPLYKWTDSQGNIHFSDKLPANAKAQPLKAPLLSISGTKFVPGENKLGPPKAEQKKPPKEDYYCGKYKKEINKISIYLRHTPNDRDKQKLADLKQQMKLECRNGVYRKSYKNSSCRSHARKLNKYIIYNKHTPTDRDQQTIKDLKKQIKLECG